jgi:hypothetical protein
VYESKERPFEDLRQHNVKREFLRRMHDAPSASQQRCSLVWACGYEGMLRKGEFSGIPCDIILPRFWMEESHIDSHTQMRHDCLIRKFVDSLKFKISSSQCHD